MIWTAYGRFTVFCRSVASAVVLATCCWWTPPGKSATRPRPLAFTGGHTETTACDRHTENCPWVLLTGQQPGVLAGDGRAHSRLQCAGWPQTLQEEKKEKKQFETGHHEPRRLHTHRWEVADWMVFARRLGDLLFQTAAWLRCGSGALRAGGRGNGVSRVRGVRGALGVWRSGFRSWRLSLADTGKHN